MRIVFSILLLLVPFSLLAQDSIIIHLNHLPSQGVLLNTDWKFRAGDDTAYANPEFDDSQWQPIEPNTDISDLPQLQQGIGWFRLNLLYRKA